MSLATALMQGLLAVYSFKGIRNLTGRQTFFDLKALRSPALAVESARIYYDPYLKLDISGTVLRGNQCLYVC